MIKIDGQSFLAEQVIEVVRENTVPEQPVEEGFVVQDSVREQPLQLRLSLLLFDKSTWKEVWNRGRKGYFDPYSGKWVEDEASAPATMWEEDFDERHEATYAKLQTIYENKEPIRVDCSDYSEHAATTSAGKNITMIYDDMVMVHLGQLVQQGKTYLCQVLFTQIKKNVVKTTTLYVQEEIRDEDTGVVTQAMRWSKEPIEPTNTESLSTPHIDMSTDSHITGYHSVPPISATRPGTGGVSSAIDDVLRWAHNLVWGE